jgi:hypothetical protein
MVNFRVPSDKISFAWLGMNSADVLKRNGRC